MTEAALAPRVRTVLVCTDVIASEIENGVFTLDGVRHHLTAESFPWQAKLNLFLVLSNPRSGLHKGRVLIVHDETDRRDLYVKFDATFEKDNELLPLHVELGWCRFLEPGRYTVQVSFYSPHEGKDVLKGELPFEVLLYQE